MKISMSMMILMLIIVVLAFMYVLTGIHMHSLAGLEELKYHNVQADYYSHPKSIRDSAEEGSELLSQLATIENYPSELMRLKLVGLGKMLTGIFMLLFGIMITLVLMPMRMAEGMHMMMHEKKKK